MATSQYVLENSGSEIQQAINDALINLPYNIGLKANLVDVLTKTNTMAYTPTDSYHPATKAYVDSAVAGAGSGTVTSVGLTTTDTAISISGSPVTTNGNISISINKETSISSSSTNLQIPTAKAVYDLFNSIVNADNINY